MEIYRVYLAHSNFELRADDSSPLFSFAKSPDALALFPSRRFREERLRLRHASESRNTPVGQSPPVPPPPPPNPSGAGSDHAANRVGGAWQAGVVGVGMAAAAGSGGGSVLDEGRGRRSAGAAAARQLEVGVFVSCFGGRTTRRRSRSECGRYITVCSQLLIFEKKRVLLCPPLPTRGKESLGVFLVGMRFVNRDS